MRVQGIGVHAVYQYVCEWVSLVGGTAVEGPSCTQSCEGRGVGGCEGGVGVTSVSQ